MRHDYGFLNMNKYSDHRPSLSEVTKNSSSDFNQAQDIQNQSINHQDVAIQRNCSTDSSHITTLRNLHKISDIQNLVTAKDNKIDAGVLNSQNEKEMIRLRRNTNNSTEKPRKKNSCCRNCNILINNSIVQFFVLILSS